MEPGHFPVKITKPGSCRLEPKDGSQPVRLARFVGPLCLLAAVSLYPMEHALGVASRCVIAGLVTLLLGVTVARRDWETASPLLLVSLLSVTAVALMGKPGVVLMSLPLVGYGAIVRLVPPLRPTVPWLRIGRFDGTVWSLVAGFAVVSAIALIAWYRLLQPDVRSNVAVVPNWRLGYLVLLALGFAIVNALAEESIWRGVFLDALLAAGFGRPAALVVQAASFGAAHFLGGMPSGMIGVGLAFVGGLMFGGLREFARGMGAPVAAHALGDAVVATILIVLARQ